VALDLSPADIMGKEEDKEETEALRLRRVYLNQFWTTRLEREIKIKEDEQLYLNEHKTKVDEALCVLKDKLEGLKKKGLALEAARPKTPETADKHGSLYPTSNKQGRPFSREKRSQNKTALQRARETAKAALRAKVLEMEENLHPANELSEIEQRSIGRNLAVDRNTNKDRKTEGMIIHAMNTTQLPEKMLELTQNIPNATTQPAKEPDASFIEKTHLDVPGTVKHGIVSFTNSLAYLDGEDSMSDSKLKSKESCLATYQTEIHHETHQWEKHVKHGKQEGTNILRPLQPWKAPEISTTFDDYEIKGQLAEFMKYNGKKHTRQRQLARMDNQFTNIAKTIDHFRLLNKSRNPSYPKPPFSKGSRHLSKKALKEEKKFRRQARGAVSNYMSIHPEHFLFSQRKADWRADGHSQRPYFSYTGSINPSKRKMY